MTWRNYLSAGAILIVVLAHLGAAPIIRSDAVFRPVEATNGMVVSAERHASEAGLAVLEKGGNAVDAAVTMGFTLAVTLPRAGNLGGGGFMMIHDAESGQTFALDYREMAPSGSTREMFLNESGDADPALSRDSPLAVGVPGTVAGLLAAHERFGRLPLAELMAPAIRLARDGFVVETSLEGSLAKGLERLGPEALAVFTNSDGEAHKTGDLLIQPDLADSLERILEAGRDGFYTGKTAEAIVGTLMANGGVMQLDDLAKYEPVWREPVSGGFRDFTIQSMPPPSSGGVHLIQMLHLIENFPLKTWGPNSGQGTHIMIEIMKRAYADRSKYLGDPDFVDVPVEELLSKEYTDQTVDRINSMTPTASEDLRPGELPQKESPETTHFSVVDREGNAVANTYTLNFSYGCGIMAAGTGILLNNQMDDFSAKPGTSNAYGLVGGEANSIEPGKRMLSSMTPTIVLKGKEVYIVTGSPGGSRIITTVLEVLLNIMEFGMNPAEANYSPRFHHQWLPDILYVERGFPSDALRSLRLLGYNIQIDGTIGAAQTIVREKGGLLMGASDPRRDGGTVLGY